MTARSFPVQLAEEKNAMQCPVCDERLRDVEKYGVKVSICPGCKGMWVARGLLDEMVSAAKQGGDGEDDNARQQDRREDERGDPREPEGRKKRGGWLGDLLDGFGGD
jgi:Zn-finger nucleic acid-binding protein